MYKGFSIVAVIPARGGSKRLPGKNIKKLNGIPLIAHSINQAKECSYIDGIFVTTDDDSIINVANQYGVSIIKRPSNLATDFSSTAEAIDHAYKQILLLGFGPDIILILQPTNPLRPKDLVESCISEFCNNMSSFDTLITVSENHLKLGKISTGCFSPLSYQLGQRSQDLDKLYYENGLLYLVKKEVLEGTGNIFGKRIYPKIINTIHAQVDIDEQIDFEWAEFIINKI